MSDVQHTPDAAAVDALLPELAELVVEAVNLDMPASEIEPDTPL